MADKLVNAGVIDDDIGFGQFPNGSLNTGFFWHVHLADRTMLFSVGVRQAELDRQWLQSGVVSQE